MRAKIATFFGLLGIDDLAARRLLAPDFTWWISGFGQIDDGFIAMGAAMSEHLAAPIRFRVVDAVCEELVAFVEVEETAALIDGAAYSTMSAYKLKFGRDGLIVSVREYTDTKGAAAVWGPRLA